MKNRSHSFLNKYYQWRYWSNLYLNMKNKKIEKVKTKESPYLSKPGIVFSFDDSFRVEHWLTYGKKIFGFYDVKATFNINAFHHFEDEREHTQKEIDMLLELQENGHEIAHHGFKHKKATDYTMEYGSSKWVEDEIESLFTWLENQSHSVTKDRFKSTVSFAFPHFDYNDQNIKDLVSKYYKIVRGHFHNDNLTPHNYTGFAPSICLDSYYSCNLFYLKKIMKIAREKGQNLILSCHSILPNDVDWNKFGWEGERAVKSGTWRISPETIQSIIEEAKKIGLEFYTTSEIAGVATFIDRNFEKSVRKLISNPKSKWILISELSEIKELDLSNKNINNLDGIQYFVKVESLNLSNNNIRDFRLLEKLPKLKSINGTKKSQFYIGDGKDIFI